MELKPISYFKNMLTQTGAKKYKLNPVAIRRVESHAVRLDSVGPGVNMQRNGDSVAVWGSRGGGVGGGKAVAATVTAWGENSITATVNGVSSTVWKQPQHQVQHYDGLEITYADGTAITYAKDGTNPEWKRTATISGNSITEILVPLYYTNQPIYVVPLQSGDYVDLTPRQWARSG